MPIATVILAAGLGTRMKSGKTKVLHELAGKALIGYPVELSLKLKAAPIVAVLGHQADRVKNLLEAHYPGRTRVAIQKEQLGTGHAVLSAQAAFRGYQGSIVILSGDVPRLRAETVKKLVALTKRRKSPLGLVASILDDPSGYGRVVRGEKGHIRRVVEHRDADASERAIREANMGVYVVDSRFLFSNLKKIGTNNDQGEYYLPDLVQLAADAGLPVVSVEAPEEELLGINDRVQLERMERVIHEERCRDLMRAGVTLRNARSVWIGDDVRIGNDTEIFPNCRIGNGVRIGNSCRVEEGCVLEDCVLGDEVHLKPYTLIESAKVARGAELGPFARIRPGSNIGENVKIGNFVETKKTTMAAGAKASHLSYLGDAVIGRNTNVGAGTITCNYDGYNKFPTTVGEDVLIGSDTQLIAPVNVPDRAVLGAGTSLASGTEIPEGALVVMRPEPTVIPGYRDRLEKRSRKAKKAVKSGKKSRKTKR